MELKTLSNKHLQYKAAGLEEAYHLVYYIPQGDTTTWTARVARFKNRADEEDFQLIKSMTIEAFINSRLTFDYVIRVLGHNETVPLKSAKIREYVYDIASAIGAKYLPQLLNKTRSTAALHLSLIHISEPTRLDVISYAVFCLKKNFFNDTATTEIYTLHIVGSVRCV